MSSGRYWLVAIPVLWLAAALQEAVASRMTVANVPPDLLLCTLCALALLDERKSGTVVGFLAGALRGALAGANLAAYTVSRTLLGFGLGWIRAAGLIPNGPVAGVSAFVGTLAAQGLVMLVAHRGPVLPFLGGTLYAAAINGALAIPLYAVLRRLIDPSNDR